MLHNEHSVKELFSRLAAGRNGIWYLDNRSGLLEMCGEQFLDDIFGDPAMPMPLSVDAYLAGWCHPDEADGIRDCLRSARKGAAISLVHRLWSRKRGVWRRVRVYARLTDLSGNPVCWGSVHRTDDRGLVEAFLNAHCQDEEHLKVLIEAMPLCGLLWDATGRLVACNRAAASLFGLANGREVQGSFSTLAPTLQPGGESSECAVRDHIRQALIEGFQQFVWVHRKPDGVLFPVEVTLVRTSWGNRHMVAGYARELRPRPFAGNARLSGNRTAGDVAGREPEPGDPAHRRPRCGLSRMLEILDRGTAGLRRKDAARQATKCLLRLVDDILDFSDLESGSLPLEAREFSVAALLKRVRDALGEACGRKGLDLSVRVDPSVPDRVRGEAERLKRVLLCLAGNAILFTAQGTVRIEVRVKKRAGNAGLLLFTVRDPGTGQEDAAGPPPPEWADRSASRNASGLDQALHRRYARLTEGLVWCEGGQGRGNVFCFTSPFSLPGPAEPETARSGGRQGPEAERTRRRIAGNAPADRGNLLTCDLEALRALRKRDCDWAFLGRILPETGSTPEILTTIPAVPVG